MQLNINRRSLTRGKILLTVVLMIALLAVHGTSSAEQDPLYSQYINNPFVLNPAYAGFTKNLQTTLSYRQQWSGFEGSPKTINASGHLSLFDNRTGAGVMIVSDQIGSSLTTEIVGSYAYRIPLGNTRTLSFGLQAGMTTFKVDNSDVKAFDVNDPYFQGSLTETKPNFGAGLILNSDRYFLGLSVPRMMNSSLSQDGFSAATYTQHYYAMGSYLFFLTDRIRFKPSLLMKLTSGAPASMDANASLILREQYQVGVLTRNFNTYGFLVQGVFKDFFRVGYVFEVPTGSSVGPFYTHQLTLGLRFNVLNFHDNSSVMSF